MAIKIPYPVPDPFTGQWDPFAMKQNLDFLAAAVSSVSAIGSGNVIAVSSGEVTGVNVAKDYHTMPGLTIAIGDGAIIYGNYRKTSGAGNTASIGLKVNGSAVIDNFVVTSTTNRNEDGFFRFTIYARAANYVSPVIGEVFNGISNAAYQGFATASIGAVTITSLAVTGVTAHASITLGMRNVIVTRVATSSVL